MKVVDTLEKFEQGLVDKATPEGKQFVLFKRQLYMMYEVQNRSAEEHDALSFRIERSNLKWLYNANLDFVEEMVRVNKVEQAADIGSLKGAVFKRKLFTPNRLKALGSFGLAAVGYSKLVALQLLLGPTLPAVGIAGLALYGIGMTAERNFINTIRVVQEGEHAGFLQIAIQKSPIVTTEVFVHPRHIHAVCSLGNDDLGDDDTENHLVHIEQFTTISGETSAEDTYYVLPADSFKDRELLDHVLSKPGPNESTYDDFNDLMLSQFNDRVLTGGLKGVAAIEARQTGYANHNLPEELNQEINEDALVTEENLLKLQEHYGRENLENMPPQEFYKLYCRFVAREA